MMGRIDTPSLAWAAILGLLSFSSVASAQVPPPRYAPTQADAGATYAPNTAWPSSLDGGVRGLNAADAAATAWDASTQSDAAVDPNALTMPSVVTAAEPAYPEAALAEKREATVLLVLTIAADGRVEDAVIGGAPSGYGFDEAALEAARRIVFAPATKGGKPIRARIQYQFQFRPPAPPPAPEQRTGDFEITLRSAEDNRPVVGAEAIFARPDEPAFALRLTSDGDGRIRAPGLTPGSYDIALSHPRFTSERHTEQLTPGETTELTYRFAPVSDVEEYGAVARVKAPPREVTRRTIQREELTRVAGTRGDALRTIELLPGVSRPPFTAGIVLVRGAAPGDTQILLDGVPVPLLYHFGGLTSFINSRALERIDFYPGNFSVRYGRAIGGIIDVGVRDAATDSYRGVVDINLPLDSSLLLEGPITDKASFMVGGRRSYLGEVLTAGAPDNAGPLAAPVYYDYQGFVTYRPTDRDRLRIGGYGSSDRLQVLFTEKDDDPAIERIEVAQQFHRAQVGWRHQYTKKLDHDLQFAAGRNSDVISFPPDFNLDLVIRELYLRAEWRYRVSDKLQLIAGTDNQAGFFSVSYLGPTLPDQEGSGAGAEFEVLPQLRYRKDGFGYSLAGYVEAAITPVKPLRIVPGMRIGYDQLIDRFAYDPRIAIIYSVLEGTRVKAGVGLFSQPPLAPQALRGFGNPNLLWTKAIHYSAGVEHDFTEVLSLGLEGFYKDIYDRVVSTDFQAATMRGMTNPLPYDNDGIGRVYGLEVSGRKQAKGRWFGFLSYTLMKSERKDHDQPWRLFNYDQTHILSLAGTALLGRGWEAGGVLRVVTGNPTTPIAGASFDQDIGEYTPENGRFNSVRTPTFHRLDIRVEKKWTFDWWRLAAYLDIQNVYNRRHPEGTSYSFDYRQRAAIKGLPIIPIIGVRGER
jgi:TonB family protein